MAEVDTVEAAPQDAMEFPSAPQSGGFATVARAVAPAPTVDPATQYRVAGVGNFADAASAIPGTFSAGQDARQREIEQARIRANAMRPEYAQIRDALTQREGLAAKAPQAPTLLEPPSRGLRDFLAVSEGESPVAAIGKLVQALSLFAGSTVGLTRNNAVGALAAMAGAMDGWAKGDAERADAAFKDWEAKTAQALKTYELQRQQYNDALTASDKTLDGRVQLARLKALEFGDQEAVLALETGSLDKALGILSNRDDAANKVSIEVAKLLDARQKAALEQAKADEIARHHRATEAHAAEKLAADRAADAAEAAQFTPQAIELAANTYIQTGSLPPLGMGKSGVNVRGKILNRAAELAESMGGVEGQAARNALYKANAAELVKLQTQRGPVMAFEKTARENIKIAKDLSNKVDRTGVPVFNRWSLAGRKAVQGDPDVAAFDAAVRVSINEVAKVTSGSTGGAVTSDSARREIESMLNTAMTKPQFDAVVNVLERDMDSRIKGFDEQISMVTSALKPKATEAKPTRDRLSKSDARYKRLREQGMSDLDIGTKFQVDLVD